MTHPLYILNEIKVSYTSHLEPEDRMKIGRPLDSYNALLSVWNMDTIDLYEEMKVMMLDTSSRVIGVFNHSTGSSAGVAVDSKLIFATALKANAQSIVLAHNHPSGNLNPSHADREITHRLIECGKMLELPVVDHIIVSRKGFYSFVDNDAMY
ncbi:JAB domain-containing protein [Dyadobacter sp. CY356]|uniref:JAB domain-containing protein n=1 Tax=Dyadobacter sp. CY356 TaxID=2906442 RepID=UPI001F28B2C0|nr:JAB domain-containing protein [Dyadobacter sp. CY356]MCF0055555.1 JAB domain-containing protein [Dyadobacter sp. CY356]